MMAFMSGMKQKFGFVADKLNLGGGYGIWYTDEDAKISSAQYALYLDAVVDEIKAKAKEYSLGEPYKSDRSHVVL